MCMQTHLTAIIATYVRIKNTLHGIDAYVYFYKITCLRFGTLLWVHMYSSYYITVASV